MTLDEAKDQAARQHEFTSWDSLVKMLKFNGVYEQNIGVFFSEAAELYARSKWDDAIELAQDRIFSTIDESRERIEKLKREFKP